MSTRRFYYEILKLPGSITPAELNAVGARGFQLVGTQEIVENWKPGEDYRKATVAINYIFMQEIT